MKIISVTQNTQENYVRLLMKMIRKIRICKENKRKNFFFHVVYLLPKKKNKENDCTEYILVIRCIITIDKTLSKQSVVGYLFLLFLFLAIFIPFVYLRHECASLYYIFYFSPRFSPSFYYSNATKMEIILCADFIYIHII